MSASIAFENHVLAPRFATLGGRRADLDRRGGGGVSPPDERTDAPPVEIRDSAHRAWRVELRQESGKGRFAIFSPVHGDLEPFRASADGYRPDAYQPMDEEAWKLFASFVARPEDDDARGDAQRVFDRLVRAAQHASLLGAVDEDDEDSRGGSGR